MESDRIGNHFAGWPYNEMAIDKRVADFESSIPGRNRDGVVRDSAFLGLLRFEMRCRQQCS